MKKGWGVEKSYYLFALIFIIIIPFILLTIKNENWKKASTFQAVKVVNKEGAKTVAIQKKAAENKEPAQAANAKIQESYGKLPMYFIANKGQVDEKVRFYEKGSGHAAFFTKEGVYLSLTKRSAKESESQSVRESKDKTSEPLNTPELPQSELIKLNFLEANKEPKIIPENQQEGKVNYFIGNDPNKWRTNIPTYQAVVYKELYKGIDVKFYGANRQMEYDIIVKPGADPSNIKFSYDGAKELKIADNGDMEIVLNNEGSIIQKKPYIYQEINGKRVEVDGKFKVEGIKPFFIKEGQGEIISETSKSQFAYSFELASYNPSYSLIIDPILVYSTYLGGSFSDVGDGIAVDSTGNAYVTGYTNSTNFPTTIGVYDTVSNGNYDAFVAKLNSTGTALVYSTYLGGSFSDVGNSIAVDSAGNAYVTGYTYSTNFPATTGAYDTTCGGCSTYSDVFVTQLNSTGTALVYSTYLGGSFSDVGNSIAVDSTGNAYVTGSTYSTDFSTTTGAYDTTCGGCSTYTDVFVTQLNSTGTALVYSTYLGGSFSDVGNSIAVDSTGNAYVTGSTYSTDFSTTTGAYDTTCGGCSTSSDAFVVKFNSAGTALVYSTYLGGSGIDYGYGIAVDSTGNAYVTGATYSTNFSTTTGAYDTASNGGADAFVTKLNSTGTALVYSTYLGGSVNDFGYGIAVDSTGNVYITGSTYSTNFPTTGAYDTTCGGCSTYSDAFVAKFNSAGTALIYSTYLGGSSYDYGYGIAADSTGNVYVTGYTVSVDFSTTTGAYDTTSNGSGDAFVVKIGDVSGQYALSVTKSGIGTGTVTSSPAGINCGNDCYENYAGNTVVSLTATPGTGYSFVGWTGDADCSDGVVTMSANKTCTATFNYSSGGGGGGGCSQCQWCCKNTSTGNCESYFTDCCNADPDEMTKNHCNNSDLGGGGGCGSAIIDTKKDNQPPASGMMLLLLVPLLTFISWLIYRRFKGALWLNWKM